MAEDAQVVADASLTVLLIDDNARLREVLRRVLEAGSGWEIVGEAGDGAEGIAQAQALQPRVIVLDQQMPELTGTQSLLGLRRLCPYAAIIMWSSDPTVRDTALRLGADAFLDKAEPLDALTDAMRSHVKPRPVY